MKSYFPALTGIRAVAAYMVFAHHYFDRESSFANKIPTIITYCFTEFHIGVTIFFMLSGFLIGHRYQNTNEHKWGQYLLNRFARIYPVFFVLTTITFIYYKVYPDSNFNDSLVTYLLNITFLKSFFQELKFTGIAQSWSLTVEEMFYLCAPITILLLKRSWRMIIIIPAFLLFVGALISTFNIQFGGYKLLPDIDFVMSYTFFGRAFEFTAGVFIAIYASKHTYSKISLTYIGIAGILLSTIILVIITSHFNILSVHHLYGQLVNNFLLPIIGVGPLFIGLIKERTIVSRVLSSKLFLILGKSSYVFYLIHMGVFYILIDRLTESISMTFLWLSLLSIIIFYLVEEPLNKNIRKLSIHSISQRLKGDIKDNK